MKKTMPLILIVFSFNFLFSQDIIVKLDGNELKAKVLEVTSQNIKFKEFDFQEGPTRNISISDVFMVIYENGKREKFTTSIIQNKKEASSADALNYPSIGIGMQFSLPAGGVSLKADITKHHTLQAVVGLFGPYSSYYGRYLFNFKENGNDFKYKPYLYGQAGVFEYDFESFYDLSESVFGFGFGGGFEWYYAPFTDRIRFNTEIGYGKVDLEYYDFKSFSFGGGIHYYFDF